MMDSANGVHGGDVSAHYINAGTCCYYLRKMYVAEMLTFYFEHKTEC